VPSALGAVPESTPNPMRLAQPALLRQLRVFCVAARSLSFKSAAASMYLTPSAVSHQVRELEEHLGVRLFERKTRAHARQRGVR